MGRWGRSSSLVQFCLLNLSPPPLLSARRYWQSWPSSTSFWNALQWSQVWNEPEPATFRRFNYGAHGSPFLTSPHLLSPSSLTPPHPAPTLHPTSPSGPEYNLANVKVPTILFSGGKDVMASARDIALTKKTLAATGCLAGSNFQDSYSHMDFIWDPPTQRPACTP
jgi:hypothetical protein